MEKSIWTEDEQKILWNNIDIVENAATYYCKLYCFFDYDDFYMIGLRGLMNAVKSYDKNKGCTFHNYAFQKVKHEIINEIRKYDKIITGPDAPPPFDTDISDDLIKKLEELSLEEEVSKRYSVEKEVLFNMLKKDIGDMLNQLEACGVNPVYIEITKTYFGIDTKSKNMPELAHDYGFSTTRISQIIKSVTLKIRRNFPDLKEYVNLFEEYEI